MTADAVRALFRGVWKLVFVVVLTLAVLTAIGWAIQALGDEPGGGTATTVEE